MKSAGEASGVTNTFRQVGISLGTAIIGAVLISSILIRLETAVQQSGSIPQQSKQGIRQMLIDNSAELAFGDHGTFKDLAPATQQQLTALRRAATTNGMHRAFVWCAAFAMMAFVVSTFLPLRPEGQKRGDR